MTLMSWVAGIGRFFSLCLTTLLVVGSAIQVHARDSASKPSIAQPEKPMAWPVVYPDDTVSILLTGDTGFGGHRQPVRDGHGMRHGKPMSYARMTSGIASLLNSDAAFANLETVISDHNRLRPAGKRFVFRSHPSGVRHLADLGFNLFSTSNNHVGDFGSAGVRETLDHLQALRDEGHEFVAAGLGRDRDAAARPKKIKVKNAELYLSAVGIGGGNANRRGAHPRAGHLHYRTGQDFEDALSGLQNVGAGGFRMLSVHYGEESQVYTSQRDIRRLRDMAVRGAGVDLVIGHHAHVPRGVARVGESLIFYGLGNFMHPGMQNMARLDRCRDFGLVARVHLGRVGPERYRAMAIEAIPITDMHNAPRVLPAEKAKVRIGVLNGLARSLDDAKSHSVGVRFHAREDGTGLACFDGAQHMSNTIGKACKSIMLVGAKPVAANKPALEPALSCRRYHYLASAKKRRYSNKRRRARKKQASFFSAFGF